MAVTGEFLADFNDFVRGAKQAEGALNTLEGQSTSMESAWNKAFSGIDIEKAFNAPIQTGTALAKDFIGSIGTWGPIALGAAAGVTAIGAAVWTLADSAANTADNLGDLADKTGMTVPELSRLSNAATLAGTTVEALADVSYTMQSRMAKNPKEFAEGLKILGINAEAFAAAKPDVQLELFTQALVAQEDPQQRIIAGQDIIGKQYKELGPALQDLGGWALEAGESVGYVFTQADADAAEEYKRQLNIAKLELQAVSDEIGARAIPLVSQLARNFNELLKTAAREWEETKSNLRWFTHALEEMGLKTAAANPHIEELNQKKKVGAQAEREFAAAFDVTAEAKRRDKEVDRELDAQQREREKHEKEAAAETEKRLDAAVKHYADVTKEYEKLQGARAEAENKIGHTLQDLWNDYYDAVRVESADATQRQIDDVWRHANETEMALAQAGTLTQEASRLIQATAEANANKIRAHAAAQTELAGAIGSVGAEAEATAVKINQTTAAVEGLSSASKFMPGTYSAPSSGFHEETRFGQQVLVGPGGQVQTLERKYGAGGFLGYGLPGGPMNQRAVQVNMQGILLANDPAARSQFSDIISRTVTDTLKSQGVRLGSG